MEADTTQVETVTGEVLTVDRRLVRAFVGQPRKRFEPIALLELAENILENGQIVPALAKRLNPPINGCLYELIGGERRWRATELKNIPVFRIEIDPNVKTEYEQFKRSVIENCCREDLTPVESAHAIDRFRTEGETYAAIAKIMGKSPTWVTQHHNLLKLHPDVLKLVDLETPEEKRLTFQLAQILITVPISFQVSIANTLSTGNIFNVAGKTSHSKNFEQSRPASKPKR